LKSGIATRNAPFNELIEQLEHVAARSRDPILLTGPTGAGKSQLAKRIYELKRARHQTAGAFVEINCATLRGDGAMSTLFGHRKGAFTGAVNDRPGLLRAADGGVLFLDEVGELGIDEQAMLLRALEEKRFLPMGSDKEVTSDFLLIAGTNRDLAARVREGCFREDLLARINLWTFRLPALRERLEDIEPNIEYELEQVARRSGTGASGRSVRFNKEARELFLRFATSPDAAWSGNCRDLSAAITRMATLASSAPDRRGGGSPPPLSKRRSRGSPIPGAASPASTTHPPAMRSWRRHSMPSRSRRWTRSIACSSPKSCASAAPRSRPRGGCCSRRRAAQELIQRCRPPSQVPRPLRADMVERPLAGHAGLAPGRRALVQLPPAGGGLGRWPCSCGRD
jgi:transcriptional regulator with GAF, ATPase, and Fis domain